VTFFLFAAIVFSQFSFPTSLSAAEFPEARVIKVNDGDTITIILDRKRTITRLIGIDAPEMGQRPWGRRAKEHLIGIMNQCGWIVRVEHDVVERDKYNRHLVYIRTREGKLVNEQMVRDGHAVLFTFPPNVKYVDVFTQAQKDARQAGLGIWGPKGLKETPYEYRKKHPRKEKHLWID
jgi:micrococcal nuclease